MEHQRRLLSKENAIEHKHKSARFSSFSLPNPWIHISQYHQDQCEKIIANQPKKNYIVKFYVRDVDDTLLLIKNNDIYLVLNNFNSFSKTLKFTLDT